MFMRFVSVLLFLIPEPMAIGSSDPLLPADINPTPSGLSVGTFMLGTTLFLRIVHCLFVLFTWEFFLFDLGANKRLVKFTNLNIIFVEKKLKLNPGCTSPSVFIVV